MKREDGDVILIAGKGHEDYQIIGDQNLILMTENSKRSDTEKIREQS